MNERAASAWRGLSRRILGALFVLAGLNHFWHEAFYVSIVPAMLPAPALLVRVSGAAEIILGAALWFERTRRAAAWGLIALVIAVWPANWTMALHPDRFPRFSPALLWIRLPLQISLIAWAWSVGRGPLEE